MQVEKEDNTKNSAERKHAFRKNSLVGRVSVFVLVLLFLQFLLGMLSNLFATFPLRTPSVNPLDTVLLNGPYVVSAHIINGIIVGILSILTIVLSAVARNRRLIFLSCCGFISILFAGESGILFALGWYTNNYLSFSMTIGFALSLAIYFLMSASFVARNWFSS